MHNFTAIEPRKTGFLPRNDREIADFYRETTAKFSISAFRGAAKFRLFYRERFVPLVTIKTISNRLKYFFMYGKKRCEKGGKKGAKGYKKAPKRDKKGAKRWSPLTLTGQKEGEKRARLVSDPHKYLACKHISKISPN